MCSVLYGVRMVLFLRACVEMAGIAAAPVSAPVINLQPAWVSVKQGVGATVSRSLPREARDATAPIAITRASSAPLPLPAVRRALYRNLAYKILIGFVA